MKLLNIEGLYHGRDNLIDSANKKMEQNWTWPASPHHISVLPWPSNFTSNAIKTTRIDVPIDKVAENGFM